MNREDKTRLRVLGSLAGVVLGMAGFFYHGSDRSWSKAEAILYDQTIEPSQKNKEYSRLLDEDRKHGLNAFYCALAAIVSAASISRIKED